MRSLVKIKPSRNGEITLSFTDVGKSCHSRDLTWQIHASLLSLFAKNKFSRKYSEYMSLNYIRTYSGNNSDGIQQGASK